MAGTIAAVESVPIDRLRHAVPAFPSLPEVWLELILAYQAQGHHGRQAGEEDAS